LFVSGEVVTTVSDGGSVLSGLQAARGSSISIASIQQSNFVFMLAYAQRL